MVKKNLHEILHLIKNAQVDMGEPPPNDAKPNLKEQAKPAIQQVLKQYTNVPGKKQKEAPLPKNNVTNMQKAILEFAKMLQQSDVMSFGEPLSPQGKGRGQFIGDKVAPSSLGFHGDPNAKPLDPQEEELGGFNPFGNFLMNNYIKTKGHQYLNVDLEQPDREAKDIGSVDAKNIRGLIQTMKHIGTPEPTAAPKPGEKKPVGRGENVPDGIWDVRTNNALRNIAALMSALLNFAKDMGKNVQGYNITDLTNFKNGILSAPEQVAPARKEAIAGNMFLHIKKMEEYYNSFKEQILDNPKYKTFISQQNAFSTIKMDKDKLKQVTDPKEWISKLQSVNTLGQTSKAKAYYDAHKDQSPTNYFGVEVKFNDKPMRFNYSQLSDVNAFKARIKEYLGKEPSTEDIKGVFDSLKTSIKSLPGKSKPQPSGITHQNDESIAERQREWEARQKR